MSTRREFIVYLSSTLADLEPERETAIKAIAESGVVSTSYRASEDGVVVTCTQDVRKADLYVGIIGLRYGYQPPDQENNPEHKSITELEYDACQVPDQRIIPRFIFFKSTKAGIPEEHIDALSNPETADLIKAFRAKANSKENTPFEFKDLNELKAEIRIRVKEKATEYHQNNATTKPILIGIEPWSEQLTPVAIGCVPGTDQQQLEKIQQTGASKFKAFALSPDENNYLNELDKGIRTAQLGVLLLTPSSLNRYRTGLAAEKFRAALDLLKLRTGIAVILCEGFNKDQLPEALHDVLILEFSVGAFVNQTEISLEQLYNKLHENLPSLSTEPCLALPYIVIAPTQTEVESLIDPNSHLFEQFTDEDERSVRKKEFQQIALKMREKINNWPANLYGTTQNRRTWQCFSPESITAEKLITNVIDRINNAQAGSRDKVILKNTRVLPRPYEFDEYLHNRFGSRLSIESIRDRGCLIVIDELALLHPLLRKDADSLLTGSKTAVVSICQCDPLYAPTGKLLGKFSFLQVGTMIQRFKADHDPHCELVLNSIERVERWLHFVIPELIANCEANKSIPQLVSKAHQLF